MKKVIIFGNSKWAELVYAYLTHDSSFEVAGFTVDPEFIREDTLLGLPVVSFENVETAFPPTEHSMLVALSYQQMNRLRKGKYFQAKAKGYELINYVSSKAITWPGLRIGDNCLISETASINPYVKIGNNVTIGAFVLIGHHSVIQDHCFISSGAVILGGVTVGQSCLIAANATIKEGITIADECLIGSGVTITNHTRERGVYIGRSPELLTKTSDKMVSWLTWSDRKEEGKK